MPGNAPPWVALSAAAGGAAALAGLALACHAEPLEAEGQICEEAAFHRESCTGEYITPPPCDDEAAAEAELVLESTCDELEDLEVAGKADGALCDWFGIRCNDDASIFSGPSCDRDSDCGAGEGCVEGRCFAGVGSDEFSQILDEHTESTETGGSAVELLADNRETQRLRQELFAQAEDSIHLSALNVRNSSVSEDMVDAFADAVSRGVEVRVLVDAVAQSRFDRDILDQLVRAGVDLLTFNPIMEWARLRLGIRGLSVNNRLHEKIIVVDGAHAVVGGRNTGGGYLRGSIFDLDLYVRGPGVSEIQDMFLGIWDRAAAWERSSGCANASDYGHYCPAEGESLQGDPRYTPAQGAAGSARTRAINSVPWEQDPAEGYFAHNAAVRGAQDSITIATGYFVPPRRLRDHLRDAAARGVDVRVLKNSEATQPHSYVYWASLNFYRELIGAGIDVREYQGSSMLHAKAMIVDGELALVGSFNLSQRSAQTNSEAVMVVRDDSAVQELDDLLLSELAQAEPASPDLSWRERVRARAHRSVDWLF